MPVQVASLTAVLDLNKRGFDTGIKSASNSLSGFGKSIGGALGALGAVGAAVGIFSGVTSAIGEMVSAARESVAVNKDLEQTILSTGGVAGVTAQAARDLADSLSAVTNFSDDAILGGENLLLTFTKIGKDVFPKATETMLDMSQKMGQDLKSSAIQLGKALEQPVKGMGALTRIGVSFSAQQKEQVKAMMAVNDIAGAQGVILDAIAKQGFGGQAKAMADPFIQLQNALGEIQETLGMGIMPMLLAAAKEVLPALQNAAKELSPTLGELGIALGKDFGKNLAEIIGMVVDLANQFFGMIDAAGKLGAALGLGGEAAQGLNIRLLPLKITFGLLGAVFSVVGATLKSLAFVINVVATGWGLLASKIDSALGLSAAVAPVFDAIGRAGTTLWQIIEIIRLAWVNLIRAMSQPLTLPKPVTPGSPTPLELGLRGINSAIRAMPPLNLGGMVGGGMTPIAAGGGNVTNNTYLQIGSQSFGPFSGAGGNDEALKALVSTLRQQLDR